MIRYWIPLTLMAHHFLSSFPRIILASASPRRADILKTILGDTPFEILPADIDEGALGTPIKSPSELAQTLSKLKCEAIGQHHPEALVIGADTVVTQDGNLFGKPTDADDAFRMLKALQGKSHQVITGITIQFQNKQTSSAPITTVHVARMTDDEIHAYIATGDHTSDQVWDKAGSYGIQGPFGSFIEKINGCYFNVVGLSPSALRQLVQQLIAT